PSPCRRDVRRCRSCQRSVVVDNERRVVGEALLAVDRAGTQALAQRRGYELVVDAPADIVGARRAAVAPPGVVLAFRMQHAVGVDPAAAGGHVGLLLAVGAQAVEPVALLGQAAGVLLVGGPVADVQAAAHDVPVTAQHVVAAAGQPLVQDRPQPLHHLELVALAQLAGRAGGDVERDHAEVAEARLDVAALLVEVRPAQRGDHRIRFAPRIDRHAAVALLGRRVAVEAVVAVRAEGRVGQLVLLGLGLLHADHVGLLLPQPVEEPLAGGRADAVGVEADDAHGVAGRGRRKRRAQARRGPKVSAPPPAMPGGGAVGHCCGLGVSGVLGGRIGYSTLGWRPVSVRRNAAMALASSSSSSRPSWAVPMIATACSRSQTWPLWKYGAVSSTLRSGAERNTYSSDAVWVTVQRPLSPSGRLSAPGRSLTPKGQ